MSTKVMDGYVTRREAAELAGVHINTIRLWESTGRVDTEKAENGVIMIPRQQIEDIAEQRRDAGMDDAARIAALETENRMLRELLEGKERELEDLKAQQSTMLDRIIQLAAPREGEGARRGSR